MMHAYLQVRIILQLTPLLVVVVSSTHAHEQRSTGKMQFYRVITRPLDLLVITDAQIMKSQLNSFCTLHHLSSSILIPEVRAEYIFRCLSQKAIVAS